MARVYRLGKVFVGYTGLMYGADVPQVPDDSTPSVRRRARRERGHLLSLWMLGMTDLPFFR